MLVFTGGIALALWQRRMAVAQRDLAQKERQRADEAADRARNEADRAKAAAEAERRAAATAQAQARRAEQAKTLLLAAFEAADVDAGAGKQTTAIEVLRRAGERIDRELADDPSLALELKTSVAFSLIGSGASDEALALVSSALAGCQGQLGEQDERVIAARGIRAEALLALGRTQEAREESSWVVEASDRACAWKQQSEAMRCMSAALRELGCLDESSQVVERAMRLAQAHPEAIDSKERMHVLHSLAGIRIDIQHPQAVETARAALEAAREYFGSKRAFSLLFAEGQLGLAELKAGLAKAAAARLHGVVRQLSDDYGPGHRHVAILLNYLVLAQLSTGDGDAAEDTMRRWEESDRMSGQPTSGSHTARRLLIGGRVLLLQRRPREAAALLERGNTVLAETIADNAHPWRQLARLELALAYGRIGRIADARGILQEAGKCQAESLRRQIYEACLLLEEGCFWSQAVDAASEAVALVDANTPATLAVLAQCALGLAQLETASAKDALATLTAAEKRLSDAHVEHSNDLAELRIWRARALLDTGNAEASISTLVDVRQGLRRRRAPSGLCALAELHMARAEAALGHWDTANQLLKQARPEALASPLAGDRRWVSHVQALLAMRSAPPSL
jgi:hypothetical protein